MRNRRCFPGLPGEEIDSPLTSRDQPKEYVSRPLSPIAPVNSPVRIGIQLRMVVRVPPSVQIRLVGRIKLSRRCRAGRRRMPAFACRK